MVAITAVVTFSSVLLSHRRPNNNFPSTNISKNNIFIIQTSQFNKISVTVRALDPQKEDLGFLLKLGAGSIFGAAAIKYGSILFPTITKPDIVEALTIIFMPVFVAVLLLFNQSRVEKK